MELTFSKQQRKFIFLIAIGIFLRFFVMAFGYNYDFESYCIVGEISGHFRNVYAETHRYNYGPVFMIIQGLLYDITRIRSGMWEDIFRVLMVSTLTMTDLGITMFIEKKYSAKSALIFFLNPVSIIITGYHNQFDNMAILLGLITIIFYNEEEKFSKKDLLYIVFASLCLMTKHIFFMFPMFVLLKKGLPIKKKLAYAFIPPLFFLFSFVPFALQSQAAFEGIMNNVFLYRSSNNAPLLAFIYDLIGFPSGLKLFVYAGMMVLVAFYVRGYEYDKQVLIYLITMVAFASAIANQYLVIPMVALCVLETGMCKYVYMFFMFVYLTLQGNGLGAFERVCNSFPGVISNITMWYVDTGRNWGAWLLFLTLIYMMVVEKKKANNE